MTRLPLPVATINTLVQMLIPPPKYAIGRLVPGVALRPEAIIGQRVEIERGPDREIPLPRELAATIALEDCEDAYGFPPYRALEPILTTWGGQDLRELERQIIAHALERCPTTLVSRRRRDWGKRIAELYVERPEWVTGIHGVDGVNGVDGANGVHATNGVHGTNGTNGVHGSNGVGGANSVDGAHAVTGVNGTNGSHAANGVSGGNGHAALEIANGQPGPEPDEVAA
jgi:hypothetical protein